MSCSRHASIEVFNDGSYFVFLGDEEHDGFGESSAYGPFTTHADGLDYLLNGPHSNPGGWWDAGPEAKSDKAPPTVSPNGRPIMRAVKRDGHWQAESAHSVRRGPFVFFR